MSYTTTTLSAVTTADRGQAVSTIVIVMMSISVAIVALRTWARLSLKTLSVDDWLMIFAVALFAIQAGLITRLWKLGGFRHEDSLTMEQLREVLKVGYIWQPFLVFDYVVVKVSVGLLVLRIVGRDTFGAGIHEWRKWLLYSIMILVAVVGILDCIFTFIQCSPPQALWEMTPNADCWDPSVQPNFAIFTAAVNALADFVFAIVPASVILKLRLGTKKRVNLSILLGLGVVSGICAIVKATYLRELSNRSDFTWETYPLFVWSSAELFVLIVCGSIPSLKPLWDRYIIRKTYISSSAERSGTDGPSTWSSASGKKKGSMWGPVMSPQRTNYGEMEVEDIEMQGSSDKRLEETS